jgi:hypothetical protein
MDIIQTMECHLSWFPTGRTDGRKTFFDRKTSLPDVLVSGKMAAQMAASTQLYFFLPLNIAGTTLFYLKKSYNRKLATTTCHCLVQPP